MRDRTANEDTPIPRIYHEEANRLASSESASAMLPVLHSIDSSLYRARKELLPPLPRSLADIVIPESLRFTEAGEEFVLLQMQNNDIIVFGAPADFDALCVKSHVYMDGTFDMCPELFCQLFTLHAFFGDRHVPLLYVLMSSKERLAVSSVHQSENGFRLVLGNKYNVLLFAMLE
ncbi:hypothetical protein R1sor_012220 [Riccia sorocarpa]|uniref:Uncharacterized protein n=1 Tax=Riccia sorocarpa TaxID=122646 RepID=A0ABD3I6H8_9MARC